MRNRAIVLSLVSGLVLGAGYSHIATAQTIPAVPLSPAPKAPQVPLHAASAPAVPHLIELRLLTPSGKLIGRVTVASLEGPLRFTSSTFTHSSQDDATLIRLQGNISVKTKRNGADVTLLEIKSEDAVVEYSPMKSAQATKASGAVHGGNQGSE